MTFSPKPRLIKLATLIYLLYIVSILISNYNVPVLYKMIFSNKLNIFWTTSLFLYFL
jgi:hypothetical protein